MKAVKIEQYGDERVLQLVDVPTPEPARDEVLIQVYAAGVNPVDWKIRDGAGVRLGLPIFLGSEVAGVIAKVGASVTAFRVGDEVYSTVNVGGYADYALTKPDAIAPKPTNIDFSRAAAIPLAGLTAWQALFDSGTCRPGSKC